MAWFSDRGGNPDIYITRTRNGTDWSPPVRVTTNTGGDFNPSLIQDDRGTFHLAWFRWTAPFRGHIFYNSSPDGDTWDQRLEGQVTNASDVDDWVPTIAQTLDGTTLYRAYANAARLSRRLGPGAGRVAGYLLSFLRKVNLPRDGTFDDAAETQRRREKEELLASVSQRLRGL